MSHTLKKPVGKLPQYPISIIPRTPFHFPIFGVAYLVKRSPLVGVLAPALAEVYIVVGISFGSYLGNTFAGLVEYVELLVWVHTEANFDAQTARVLSLAVGNLIRFVHGFSFESETKSPRITTRGRGKSNLGIENWTHQI